jgi:hypothetical protein
MSMTNQNETIAVHPFQRTLGDGPYKFVGFFYINIQAGQMGRPYINPNDIHPKFVRGAGTCAHCGQAILNVCQIQIGNGEVYGIGLDCVQKVAMPVRELTLIEKAKRDHDKALRQARKAKKGQAARDELQALIDSHSAELAAKKHPSEYLANSQGLTLLDYAKWTVEKSNDGGILFALNNVKNALKG